MKRIVTIALAAGIIITAAAVAWRIAGRPGTPAEPVVERPVTGPTIIVNKSERKLRLYSGGRLVATYRIGLGSTPQGHKQREGDGRTPEGDYYICMKNPQSKFYLSLGISYPGKSDAARGLADGLITQAQHDVIVAAIDAGEQPPWKTPLGGEIMIHGHGGDRDWTRGCIALDDADMKNLYEQTPAGTVVQIKP